MSESLKEDLKAKFRQTAYVAKESIHEFFGSWRGHQTVVNEVIFFIVLFKNGSGNMPKLFFFSCASKV